MKRISTFAALALTAAFVGSACDDITNPVEEFGEQVGPYVQFLGSGSTGTPGATFLAIIQLPTRVEEDIDIEYTFGGDAVFGEDYVIVDIQGNPRNDVTAAGGDAHITYVPDQPLFGRDTLFVFLPFETSDGTTVEIELQSATTESGQALGTGYVDKFKVYRLNIEGFVDIPTGAYAGAMDGDFGGFPANTSITKPAEPVVLDGFPYQFVLGDFAAGLFGGSIPWGLNVTSGGLVVASGASPLDPTITSNVTGSFDFDTGTLLLDVELTCCGAAGFGWSLELTHQ